MNGITAKAKTDGTLPEEISEKYQTAAADFSLDLFRRAYQPRQNSLVSPMSAKWDDTKKIDYTIALQAGET